MVHFEHPYTNYFWNLYISNNAPIPKGSKNLTKKFIDCTYLRRDCSSGLVYPVFLQDVKSVRRDNLEIIKHEALHYHRSGEITNPNLFEKRKKIFQNAKTQKLLEVCQN